jgi:hypothetical protein
MSEQLQLHSTHHLCPDSLAQRSPGPSIFTLPISWSIFFALPNCRYIYFCGTKEIGLFIFVFIIHRRSVQRHVSTTTTTRNAPSPSASARATSARSIYVLATNSSVHLCSGYRSIGPFISVVMCRSVRLFPRPQFTVGRYKGM